MKGKSFVLSYDGKACPFFGFKNDEEEFPFKKFLIVKYFFLKITLNLLVMKACRYRDISCGLPTEYLLIIFSGIQKELFYSSR